MGLNGYIQTSIKRIMKMSRAAAAAPSGQLIPPGYFITKIQEDGKELHMTSSQELCNQSFPINSDLNQALFKALMVLRHCTGKKVRMPRDFYMHIIAVLPGFVTQ